jgi:ribosomal protein L11 methyltransferase
MGFGTGHHATTRLCLSLLQEIPLEGKRVLDVGTGSGVLAIAARLLGAAEVTGADNDPDALANARENLALNPSVSAVDFRELDLASVAGDLTHCYDVILANLTGGLLEREAERLTAFASPGATTIASGFETHETRAVLGRFRALGWRVVTERIEETWSGTRLDMP